MTVHEKVRGGAEIDFNRTADVQLKLVANSKGDGENAPTHFLMRWTHGSKKGADASEAAEPNASDETE